MQQRRNEGSLRAQLGNLRGNIHTQQRGPKNNRAPMPSANKWIEDGVDHINIWKDGKTELGQLLAHDSDLSFKHNIFGPFGTMEALWYYIRSTERDDRIRNLHGQKLKNFARQLTNVQVDNFRAIIMDSNWQRICAYPVLKDAIGASDLPFELYYVDRHTGLRVRPQYFPWLLEGMEEIRRAIKENREPDFAFLMDKPGNDIYESVRPKKPVQEEKKERKSIADTSGEERAPQKPSLLSSVREQQQDQAVADVTANLINEDAAQGADNSTDVAATEDQPQVVNG